MSVLQLPVTRIDNKKIVETRKQIDEVMGVMRSNIEKMAVRGDNLENLATRAEVLGNTTQQFHKCAYEIRRKKQWNAYASKVIALGVVATIVVLSISYSVFG